MDSSLHSATKAWLIRAHNDLENASFTAMHRNDLLDTAVYHCQQAGEKALKGFLCSQGLSILKTHDLGKLVELAAACSGQFAVLQSLADALTPLATGFRYPTDDEAPMPSIQQADEALEAARQIYPFVLSALPSETHPI